MSGSLTGITTHTRKVQSLYKRALRMLENWYDRRYLNNHFICYIIFTVLDFNYQYNINVSEKYIGTTPF